MMKLPGILLAVVVGCALAGCAHPNSNPHATHINGKIVGTSYTSPRGRFTVPIPVSPEVGGGISRDDSESVTFHDNWGSKISFYSHAVTPQSPMMKVLKTEGREHAMETLARQIYGDLIVFHFHPELLGGSVSFIYVRPVGPKTGVASFIQGDRIFLVETDLLPGVQLLSKDDDESRDARDAWLENRAVELLQSMQIK